MRHIPSFEIGRPATLNKTGLIEFMFAFIGLSLLFNVVAGLVFAERRVAAYFEAEGDILLQFIFLVMYIITIAYLLKHFREVWSMIDRSWAILAIVGLVILSALWSIDPAVTMRRSGALAGTTAFGLFLACRFGLSGTLTLVSSVIAMGAALSFAAVLVAPELAIMHGWHEGAWRGVFSHKNELGQVMALGSGLLLASAVVSHRWRWMNLSLAALCGILVLKAGSASGLLALCAMPFVCGAVALVRAGRVPYSLAVAGGTVGFASVMLFWILIADIRPDLSLLGRDLTLTGRTDLWWALWAHIGERFWLGYGYGAFWLSEAGPATMVQQMIGWEPAHSHSGWLELWLDVGLVGVILVAASFMGAVLGALARLHQVEATGAYGAVLILAFLFVTNLVEVALVQQNLFAWALFVAVTATVRDQPKMVSREL